jgi:hypothetical protein
MPRMSQTPDAPIQSKFVTVFELHSTDHLDAVAPTTQQGGKVCGIRGAVKVDI